jgi:predicted LPLAT superfamily acyltransferase
MNALDNIPKRINLLMRPEETPAVRESLRLQDATDKINIISPDSYMGGVVALMGALKDGELVSIMGDRSYGADTVPVSFIGENAAFPYSAFHMAAVAGVPIVVLLCHKTADYDYLVDLSHIMRPTYRSRKNKLEQVQPWVQEYAALLETQLADYPYECFLFYDVWAEAAGKQAA